MIKVGTYVLGSFPSDNKIQIIKNAGFDFVGLGLELFQSDAIEDTVKLCEKLDLPVDNIHLTGASTTNIWNEGIEGDEICERYCNEIKRAADAGVYAGVAHITWGHKVPSPINETGLARFVKIAECAAKNNFVLGLENSVYPEYLYATMEHLKDYDSIGFTFDTGHRNAFAPDHNFLETFGDRLIVTHIADNDGENDLHLMPFDGTVNWEQIARELAKTKVGRDRILAEPSGGGMKKMKGKSAAQIREHISKMPISAEEELLIIEDEKFSSYKPLTYEQQMSRLFIKMKKLASMIDKEIAKN